MAVARQFHGAVAQLGAMSTAWTGEQLNGNSVSSDRAHEDEDEGACHK